MTITNAGQKALPPSRKLSAKASAGTRARQKHNLAQAAAVPCLAAAKRRGVITDHRVIESMRKAGDIAANIIVTVEVRLKRKLSRERAARLVAAYLRIRDVRESYVAVRAMIAALCDGTRPASAPVPKRLAMHA